MIARSRTPTKYIFPAASVGHVCRLGAWFALRTDIVTDPAETNDAATTLTSIVKALAASPRSSALMEFKSSATNADDKVSPALSGNISLSNRLSDSGDCRLLANTNAVRITARTSSTFPSSMTPKMADEIGKSSFTLREIIPSIASVAGRVGVLAFIEDPISFLASIR